MPARRRTLTPARGFSLIELVVASTILAILFAVCLPAMSDAIAQASLHTACMDAAALFTQARAHALYYRRYSGVRWVSVGGDVVLALYEDGNRNGVLTADIRKGIDRLIAGPYSMRGRYPGITFSFIPEFKGPDPSGSPIGNLKDPIRFGRGDICSFAPTGRSSPGSIYLSNGKHRQSVVRISPMTSRIQVLDWMEGAKRWEGRW